MFFGIHSSFVFAAFLFVTLRFDEETRVHESYEVAARMQAWQSLQRSYVFCDKRFDLLLVLVRNSAKFRKECVHVRVRKG